MASRPAFSGPSLSSSSGNCLHPMFVPFMIYLPEPLANRWWRDKRAGGRSQLPAVLVPAFFFFMAQQPLVGQGFLIIEAARSHSDTPHTVGLLWTSDQLNAGIST
jgi:hypothetical protein